MLSPSELKQVADLLRVSASYLRSLADRGPRMCPLLADRYLAEANTADNLRTKVEEMQS